ncbi:MAG TPA: hypothetical protein VEL11_03145, partial [Candidatus Bathyarchaeia archaeon]|nr:hypothetical protein [Candidatus Bathyarchaeia archaeon]
MFDSKTMIIVNGKLKNVDRFLIMLLCTLVITSIMGTSFGIRNSFAQEQQLSIAYASSWNNNLQPSVTNSKNLDLVHSFVSNKVVGPDRFRFITSYWTSSETFRGIDTGTSANNKFLGATSRGPNVKEEVDTNEGPQTLAVVLQYQGVVDLAGVTAALKLPAGFKAQLPLTDDRNRFDIALSNYRGHVYPSQGIVLYFSLNVLPTAKVQLPVLGPLVLHFLRTSQRSILDSLDASQQNMFAKTLSVMHTGNSTFPNSTFNDSFDFSRDYFNQFGRLIPFDFVNQVIPVIFKVTGQETLDVVTLPPGKFCGTSCKLQPNTSNTFSTQIVKIPKDVTTRVRLAVRNTGDAPVYDLDVNVTTGLQSALGINGLSPSAITIPNIPQTLFSTILPLGIVGGSAGLISVPELKPNTNEEFDV